MKNVIYLSLIIINYFSIRAQKDVYSILPDTVKRFFCNVFTIEDMVYVTWTKIDSLYIANFSSLSEQFAHSLLRFSLNGKILE